MDSETQQREVEDLEIRIERLRALYDQYFMGIEKIEPGVQRKDVERRIWLLRKEQIRNTGVRFKFQTVVQRYNTFMQYWQRSVREIENGTYKRDVLRAAKRFGAKDALTILGKKKAEQYALLAAAQEADHAKHRQNPAQIDEQEIEALEDYDLLQEDFDDAPTPASLRMHVPVSAGRSADRGPAASAAAYAARMELDFGPPSDTDVGADSSALRPSQPLVERPSAPNSPRPSQPLRGWPPPSPAVAGVAQSQWGARELPQPPRLAGAFGGDRGAAARGGQALPLSSPTPPSPMAFAPPRSGPPVRSSAVPGSFPAPEPAESTSASSPGARPLMSQVARPMQAFAGLANRPLSAARPTSAGGIGAARPSVPASVPESAPLARATAAEPRAPARDDGTLDEQRIHQVYNKYMESKHSTNESTAGVTFERLAQSLRAQEAKLRAAHAGKKVDFEVIVKDGKTTLKPIVR